MKNLLSIIACTFIAGCNLNPAQEDMNKDGFKKLGFSDAEIGLPLDLNIRPSAEPNKHQIVDSDLDKNDLDKLTEYRIELFKLESTVCSPSLTGVSHTTQLPDANGQTSWGKVDMFDHLNFESGEGAFEPVRDVVCKKMPDSGLAAVYSLCSEKDGKTVVICISQMTDNPQLAEDIFKTFRWTK